jgi:Peptidase family M28
MENSDPTGRAGSTRRTFLSVTAAGAVAAPLLGASAPALAEDELDHLDGPGRRINPQLPEKALRDLLLQVDAGRVESTITRLVQFGTRHTLSSQTDPVRGIGAATEWVYQQFQAIAATSGGRMTVEKQSFIQPAGPRIPAPTQITNVIATLQGDESPERVYVVTGHLDSRVTDVLNFTLDAPGADDDASGVACVLELARLFAPVHFKGTLVFASVAGEEQGLFGSAYMAAQMKAANNDVQGMFSNDIIGASTGWDGTRPDPHTVRLFNEGVPTAETTAQGNTRRAVGGENDGPSRQLARFVKDVGENDSTGMTVRMIYRRDRYLRASDHVSFLTQPYPANRFTEPRENFNHEHQDTRVENGVQFGDLPEFCDFGYIARVTSVNACALWSLAKGPGTPKGVGIAAQVLTNLTTLNWAASTDPDIAGYEVVYRETTSPVWTHAVDVGLVTTATIDLAKDNLQFGVRAVDKDGRHSPVGFPVPV